VPKKNHVRLARQESAAFEIEKLGGQDAAQTAMIELVQTRTITGENFKLVELVLDFVESREPEVNYTMRLRQILRELSSRQPEG